MQEKSFFSETKYWYTIKSHYLGTALFFPLNSYKLCAEEENSKVLPITDIFFMPECTVDKL